MKKLYTFVSLLAAVCLLLCACGDGKDVSGTGSTPAERESAVKTITDLLAAQPLPDGDVYRSDSQTEGEYLNDDLIGGYYGSLFDTPDFGKVKEYCVCIDEAPLKPQELGLFVCDDSATAESLASFLHKRVERLVENAKNYTSVDASGIENAIIKVSGSDVYYVILCEGRDTAASFIAERIG